MATHRPAVLYELAVSPRAESGKPSQFSERKIVPVDFDGVCIGAASDWRCYAGRCGAARDREGSREAKKHFCPPPSSHIFFKKLCLTILGTVAPDPVLAEVDYALIDGDFLGMDIRLLRNQLDCNVSRLSDFLASLDI